MVRETLQTISDYLNQSGADWLTLTQAVDNNVVVITMFGVSCIILCLSFYIVDGLLIFAVKQKGFFSNEHKRLSIWFLLFLFLVGTSFGTKILTVFYPLYWIYGGVLTITSISAILTTILYLRYYKNLSSIPSAKEYIELQEENTKLKKKEALLHEQLDVWSQNVGHQINILKSQHRLLSQEVHDSKQPSAEPLNGLTESEEVRQKVLEALTKIKEEIATLTEAIK